MNGAVPLFPIRFHGVDRDNFSFTFAVSSGGTYGITFINAMSVLHVSGNRMYHYLRWNRLHILRIRRFLTDDGGSSFSET